MKEYFLKLKPLLKGSWKGEGTAIFPTIDPTGYTEMLEFRPDEDKDVIFYNQKTKYKNQTENNGKTVFWDAGFILLKEPDILLVSVQAGGRLESYRLSVVEPDKMIFDSVTIGNDPKTIRSQRIFYLSETRLKYELNMSTHQATDFQNHLKASLEKQSG